MEVVFEFLFAFYIELMMYVVPEEKATSKKYRFLTALIACVSMMGIGALFIWGCIWVVEDGNWFGLIPILIAVVLSIAQIMVGFVLRDRKKK